MKEKKKSGALHSYYSHDTTARLNKFNENSIVFLNNEPKPLSGLPLTIIHPKPCLTEIVSGELDHRVKVKQPRTAQEVQEFFQREPPGNALMLLVVK